RRHRQRGTARGRAQGLRDRGGEGRRSGRQLHALVVRLPDRPRRPPARADAVRPCAGRLRPRSEDTAGRTMRVSLRHWLLSACSTGVVAGVAWASLAPVQFPSREEVFEIPKGTWARRMAGDKVEILPQNIRLTLGVRDVLLLRNLDEVPQQFGPTIMMPGQSFRLPFASAGRYPFSCTAHLSGQLLVVVEEFPATPWARLLWRLGGLWSGPAKPFRR